MLKVLLPTLFAFLVFSPVSAAPPHSGAERGGMLHKMHIPTFGKIPLPNEEFYHAGISLGGPCAGFSYHTPGTFNTEFFDADTYYNGIAAQPGSMPYFQRQGLVFDGCPAPSGIQFNAGEMFNSNKLSIKRSETYIAIGYQIKVGNVFIDAGLGMMIEANLRKPNPLIHWGLFYPFAMLRLHGKF